MNLSLKYRPKKFVDIVGQETELEVLKTIVGSQWIPNAVMMTGQFGIGKTTFSRLLSRALLCESRAGIEPCCECSSCKAIDEDRNSSYMELDSATHGSVERIREIKEEVTYRSSGKMKIVYLDESHMLSREAQNSLLKVLEEGVEGVMFIFATTDHLKMLPTIRSRCIPLDLKLLTAAQIYGRLKQICTRENTVYEESALRVIATYVRGHLRDAIMLLEQIIKLFTKVSEEGVRTYLRLDRYKEVYEFLCTADKKEMLVKLEDLLCNFSPSEITEIIGQILVNAYKLKLEIDDFTQVDKAWLNRLITAYGDRLLVKAEEILTLPTDFISINYAIAAIGKVFLGEDQGPRKPVQSQESSINYAMRKQKVPQTVT